MWVKPWHQSPGLSAYRAHGLATLQAMEARTWRWEIVEKRGVFSQGKIEVKAQNHIENQGLIDEYGRIQVKLSSEHPLRTSI